MKPSQYILFAAGVNERQKGGYQGLADALSTS